MAKKILIIDDDPLIVRMYERKLKADGYEVHLAFNGEEGLKKAKEVKPDLILLDILMPKLNGYETLKQIKADHKIAKIPIFVLTSLGDRPEDIKKFKEFGVNDYLVKSEISLQDLSNKIAKILGK